MSQSTLKEPVSKAEEARRNKIGKTIVVFLVLIVIIAIISIFCPPPLTN